MAAIAMVRQDLQDIQQAVANFITAQNVACVDAMTIAFENFPNFEESVKQQFAIDFISCLTVLNNAMNVPEASRAHVDLIGRGFNVVAALELFIHEHLGWETQGLLNLMTEGNQSIVARLAPFTAGPPPLGDDADGLGSHPVCTWCSSPCWGHKTGKDFKAN